MFEGESEDSQDHQSSEGLKTNKQQQEKESEPGRDHNNSSDEDETPEVPSVPKDHAEALELKEQATEAFKKKQWKEVSFANSQAGDLYQQSVTYCPFEERDLTAKLYSNIAICFLKRVGIGNAENDWSNVVNYCNLSLDIDPNFNKPVVNRAEALFQLGKYEDALKGEPF